MYLSNDYFCPFHVLSALEQHDIDAGRHADLRVARDALLRLDAARHVYGDYYSNIYSDYISGENQAFWEDFRSAMVDEYPNAFLVVCDAHEVLGDGFRAFKENDL